MHMAVLPCQFTRKGQLYATVQIGNEVVEVLQVLFSVVSVDSSFASANVAGSMSCWLAVLQQRSRESKLATVGRLYSDITASVSHFHFVKLYM